MKMQDLLDPSNSLETINANRVRYTDGVDGYNHERREDRKHEEREEHHAYVPQI